MYPTALGQDFANGVLTKYTTRPDGIYYRDPNLKIKFMLPNHAATMYYNGYVWEHRTDALGFRNRSVRIPADLILLGDSYIYGHGVNLEETVGHFLEGCAARTVMNLARQGDSAFQQAYLLTEYIGLFRPRVVLHFFFENDIRDVHQFLRPAELNAFLKTPLASIRYPERMPQDFLLKMREGEAQRTSLLGWIKRTAYIANVLDWMHFRRDLVTRAQDEESLEQDEESLEWRYTKKAILYMRYLADKHGARFVMAPITPNNGRHYAILAGLAREHGIELVDTSGMTNAVDRSLFLIGDGHLSEKGARKMALTVCQYLKTGEGISLPAL